VILPTLLFCLSALQQDPASPDRFDQWTQDLGSDDEKTRDDAERKLRGAGPDAVPALSNAAQSRDAEQAIRARDILVAIFSKARPKKDDPAGKPSSNAKTTVIYQDWTQGITFHLAPDGKVTLRAPVKDEKTGRRVFKTWRANSIEEFKKKHPDVAKQYEIDKFLQPVQVSGDARDWWVDFEEWIGPGDSLGDLPLAPKPGAEQQQDGPRLGVHISPLPMPLKERLKLGDHEGVLVRQVEKGSLAEKAGLKSGDVLLKIDGKVVKDPDQLRGEVKHLLDSGKDFDLEIARGKERKTVTVHPDSTESEEK
jgi:hypothetical protein